MMDVNSLVKKYWLQIDTHKVLESNNTWSNLLEQDKLWSHLLNIYDDLNLTEQFFENISIEEKETFFSFGVACLASFVQVNFTGPPLPDELTLFLSNEKFQSSKFLKHLAEDNEEINVNVKYPVLLVLSKIIFKHCLVHKLINMWWSWRALMIHQDILDELSSGLLLDAENFTDLIEEIDIESSLKADLYLEVIQMFLKFRFISKSKHLLKVVGNLLSIEFNLVGKLGKRTKYQIRDLPQLALEVLLTDQEVVTRETISDMIDIPQNIVLDDDVRLEQINFSDEISDVILTNVEQKLILATVQHNLIASPSDEIKFDELLPYLKVLLNQANTFSVRVVALMLRSKIENQHKRTIERSMKQLEHLLFYVNKDRPITENRFGDVFGTSLVPIWKLQKLYADTLLNIGLVRDSLDIYLQIKLWEEVIVCHTLLEQREKAVQIIKQQLDVQPTPKMMCLLGDATGDVECYETAWNMSNFRSHRAQRQWGNYLFDRKLYEQSIPHYEISSSINPLQANVWLRLGFACLQIEDWEAAGKAYRRYTTLEPDVFEAWNNLAHIYIKQGNKKSAYQAILEAIKCNFDNCKLWENLLIISCDTLHFSDVIRAYHRILDLKEKHLDIQVLRRIAFHVCNESLDWENNSSKKYLQKTRELFGRVTMLYPLSGELSEIYATLAPTLIIKAQRLQKAYWGYTSNKNWQNIPEVCLKVLLICSELADVILSDEIQPQEAINRSIKLNLTAGISSIKKHDWESTQDLITDVEKKVELISEKIKSTSLSS